MKGIRSKKIVQTRKHWEEDNPKKPSGFQGWGPLMKKFSEENEEQCKPVIVDRSAHTTEKLFSTCSKYEGTEDVLGFAGYGTYIFSNGVIYEGDFEDGMFQGDGMLTNPSGIILRGTWNKGEMTQRTLYFADGLRYAEDDWDYCHMPDRRFSIEYDLGLQPAMNSILTAEQPTKDLPPEHYDTVDGFFHTRSKGIYKAGSTNLIRCPNKKELEWIVDNCRTEADVPLGPLGHFYEEWPDPQLNFAEMQRNEATVASSTSKIWAFAGDREDDGWRLKFSQSKARLSIVATRSVAEFGARQQKTRFRWGDDTVNDNDTTTIG